MLQSIKFTIRLAFRLARGHCATLWVLVGCIALAVTALAGVDGFLGGVTQALSRESRPLLQGDLAIRSNRPLSPSQNNSLQSRLPPDSDMQLVTQLVTMAISKSTQKARLIELKAIQSGYPFYGTVTTKFSQVDELFKRQNTALVQPELLAILRIKVGDTIQIGQNRVTVIGVLISDGGAARPFALGPLVLVSIDTLSRANLTGVGSRVSYSTLVKLPTFDPDQLATQLRSEWHLPPANDSRSAFGQPIGIEIRSRSDSQGQLQQLTDRFGRFLSVASMSGVMLSTIALLYLIQAILVRSIPEIGTVRAVGIPYRTVGVAYCILLLAATAAGTAVGHGGARLIVAVIGVGASVFGATSISFYSTVTHTIGLALLMLATCLFALAWVFLGYADAKPIDMIRGDARFKIRVLGWHGVMAILGVLGLAGVSIIRSNSVEFGLGFIAILGIGVLAIVAVGQYLVLPAFKYARSGRVPFPFSVSLAYIAKSPTRLVTILAMLSLTAMIVTMVLVTQASLAKTYRFVGRNTPVLFLVDATADQMAPIQAEVKKRGGTVAPAPIVRAKLIQINGVSVSTIQTDGFLNDGQDRRAFLTREQNLSFRDNLAVNEVVIQGDWQSRPDAISLEESFAKRIGVTIGETLTFDVQGVPVTGTVTSIRSVKWNAFSPTFFILTHPRLLNGAPASFVASVSGVTDQPMQTLQVVLAAQFPNVTFVDIRSTVDQVLGVVQKLGFAIASVAGFSFAIGLLVMISMSISSARDRLGDFALLKAIGASMPQLLVMIIGEFLVLGMLVAGLGISFGILSSWAVLNWILDIQMAIPIYWLLGMAFGLIAAILSVGLTVARHVNVSPTQSLFDR